MVAPLRRVLQGGRTTDMQCEAQHRAVGGFEGNTVFANRNGPALGAVLQLV